MSLRPIILPIVQPIVRSAYGFQPDDATGPPVNLIPPDASGVPYIGGTVSTTRGAWTQNPTSYTYQWFQAPATPIAGATGMSYVIQAGDLAELLYCTVTATNSFGSASEDSDILSPVFDATDYRVDGDGNFRVVDDQDYRITGG